MKTAELEAAIASGGLIMDADEAVSRKVAYAKVSTVTFQKLPVEKTEIKVTTTHKEVKLVPPEKKK